MDCHRCEGNGEQSCRHCSGIGYEADGTICRHCRGNGLVVCSHCSGSGNVE